MAKTGNRGAKRDVFHDEEGFSTVGMVLALLVTLALLFSSAQVYQVNSAAATIQNVADAAALAAENEVAEFYIIAQTCDAVILSLSLTGIAAYGLGIAALCTPVTAPYSEKLIKAGSDIFKARNRFAEKAASGLNTVQKLLPFLSAANAESIIIANSGGPMNASYFGIAILLPFKGEEITVGPMEAAQDLEDQVDENKDDIQTEGDAAEEAAKKANSEKEQAFLHDCGNAPEYCMYERADKLASLPASENPLYKSSEAWDFSVALNRAQAYYPRRLAQEAPSDGSVDEQARSALRKRFYAYAVQELSKGYVIEDEDSFEAYFPKLPKNTTEMKETWLYTEAVYPKTTDASGNTVMHAWDGCPGMAEGSPAGYGSIGEMDVDGFVTCPYCDFTVSSFGKIAAATSSIESGFEYHYRIVADAAEAYQKARQEYSPHADKVKSTVGSLFDQVAETFRQACAYRIDAKPPGRYGAVALVVNTAQVSAATNFVSTFVDGGATLGAQAALSAATLVGESPEEGNTVISSLLDGVKDDSNDIGIGLIGMVLDLWSYLLYAYTQGQNSLEDGIRSALDAIPWASESGLGTWAAKAFSDLVKDVGLEPADLSARKPVLVNSAHVLQADDSGFSAALLRVKSSYLALAGSGSEDVFTTVVDQIEAEALDATGVLDGEITIASIEFLGEGGPSIPITIVLPPAIRNAATDLISGAADMLRGITSSWSGIRRWE